MDWLPRLLQVNSREVAAEVLQGVGVSSEGIASLLPKLDFRPILLPGVPAALANIIKQEMLVVGGDAAVAKGTVACQVGQTDVVLIGTRAQLRGFCRALRRQCDELQDLAACLSSLLEWNDSGVETLEGRNCEVVLDRPRIMGILNLTPDSFFDGGRHVDLDAALRQAERMLAEGADLIDVGGESTRPGAEVVDEETELARVVPVIEALDKRFGAILSVDTTKSRVARESLAAGAHFVNDISGLSFDRKMAAEVSAAGAGLFLMHTPARPEEMQQLTSYDDLLGEVVAFLSNALLQAEAAGIARSRLAVDPGIGFGKDLAGNLALLHRLGELRSLRVPILLGTSRKSFIGRTLGLDDPSLRLSGTLATVALGVAQGAMLHRVHDVAEARDAALMAWAVCRERAEQ